MKASSVSIDREKVKQNLSHFWSSFKYAFYVIRRPLDGFWDLTHEKRGSIAVANIIVALTTLTTIWELQYGGFLYAHVQWEYVNLFMRVAAILVLIAIWCIGNWGFTTLFDGKGKLSQIYMGTAYALTPYPLIQIPLIALSNCLTIEEFQFYGVISDISVVWMGALLFCAMMMIHDYSLGKNVLFTIATLFAMAVIVFILMLFFSLISDAIAYFVSIYKELAFRFL